MQMLPSFPVIPEVINGQVLSATTLNTYHEGLRYLLGISKERRGVQKGTTLWQTIGTNTTIYSGYAPLIGWQVSYDMWFKGGSWSWQIQVYADSGGWRTATSGSGVSHAIGRVSFTALAPYLTEGRIYKWRILASGTSAAASVWHLSIVPSSAPGWTAVPTFTDDTVSSATEINKLRTDLNALNDWQGGYGVPTESANPVVWVDKNWYTFYRGSFEWIPGMSMYCSLETKGYISRSDQVIDWQVNLNRPVRDGDYWQSENLYTRQFTKTDLAGDYKRYETVIPSSAFGTMTPGTIYSIVFILFIEIAGGHDQDGDSIWARRPIMHRIMPATPRSGWPSLGQWNEGHWISASRLNAIGTGLTNLYVGGANAIRPRVPIIATGTSVPVMHIHQRPWLVVRANPGSELKVWYAGKVGSYTESFTVKAQEEGVYTSIYLDQFRPLTYGSRYLLEGGTWSSEADEAYTG